MSRYRISWAEWHNPHNHEDDPLFWINNLPNAQVTATDPDDGWVEYEATDYFSAENGEEAQEHVFKTYEAEFFNVEIMGDDGEWAFAFTEEDMEPIEYDPS